MFRTEFMSVVKNGDIDEPSTSGVITGQPMGVGPSFQSLGLDRNELTRPDEEETGDGELDLTGEGVSL